MSMVMSAASRGRGSGRDMFGALRCLSKEGGNGSVPARKVFNWHFTVWTYICFIFAFSMQGRELCKGRRMSAWVEVIVVVSMVDPPTLSIINDPQHILHHPTSLPPPLRGPSNTTTNGAGAYFNLKTLSNKFTNNYHHFCPPQQPQRREAHLHHLSRRVGPNAQH